MEKIKKNLNYIGLLLILGGLIALRIWPYKKATGFVLIIIGFLSLTAYIFLNISMLKQGFKRKSFIYSSNLFLVIILVLGILVIINYFFSRHHHRFDFTEAKLHSLSPQSVKVLKNLEEDVYVRCFFREGNFNRSKMENLMGIYAYHSDKFKYEFIDPDKNPGLVKRYDVNQDGTSIFECRDKESRITSITEEDITNALIKVTREEKKSIYFLAGHGEASVDEVDAQGYSQAKTELEKLGYEVKTLELALAEKFPEEISLLVIPGPKKDLLPHELETIGNFLRAGGRVFFMIDPETTDSLNDFLLDFGIKLENDLIVDTVSRLLGGDYFMPVVSDYQYHSITDGFRYATFFPYARSVNLTEDAPEGITVNILAKTSPNSWSERQLEQTEVSFEEGKDVSGPLSVAAAAEFTVDEPSNGIEDSKDSAEEEGSEDSMVNDSGQEPQKKKGRLTVFGDSNFASNGYFNLSGNGNLFLNTVNWLTQEEDLISIPPKSSTPRTIHLTPTQGRLLFFVSVVILPLLVLIIGLSVWLRRRSL